MSRLDTLRKSLEEMDLEELRAHIRRIRADRRISKERPAEKKAKRVKSDKAATKASKILKGMSQEQVEALLRELEGDDSQGSPD